MRPWHSCAPEGPGPSRLAQSRVWGKWVPGPLSTFPSRRLRDLPSHPPRALHGLHPAVQWASLRGTCPAPGPLLLCLHSFLHWGGGGGQSEAESPGVGKGGDLLTQASLPFSSVSQSLCLCFPPGPHGAAGHGQHHQLVAVSPAIICVPRLGGQLQTWPAAGSFGGRGQIWAREMGAQETGVGPWGSRIFCGPLNPAPHPHKNRVGAEGWGVAPSLLLAVPCFTSWSSLLPGRPMGSSCVPMILPPTCWPLASATCFFTLPSTLS